MRSSSFSLSKSKRASVKDREMGSSRRWKLKSKELAVLIAKGASFLARVCYQSAHEHPFLVGTVLFVFLLYACLPSFFWFLVSSSPVIICTALLLGTLLIFGQPHTPEIEEEEMKTVHDISSHQDSGTTDNLILQKREDYKVENISDSTREIEGEQFVPSLEVGEPSAKVDAQEDEVSLSGSSLDDDKRMESREREFGVLGRIAGRVFGSMHLSEAYDQSEQNKFICRSSIIEGADEGTAIQHQQREGLLNVTSGGAPEVSGHVPCGLVKLQVGDSTDKAESKNFKPDICYYNLLKPSDGHDGHSDFGSDRSESCSPDASISDINPILDELCPFIPTNQADNSNIGTSARPIHADTDNSDSESELSMQHRESDYGSDEMVENMEEAEGKSAGGVAWTTEDEKNVMDLGSSEIERNQRLENLLAKHRVKKNLNREVRRLPELRNEDTSPVTDNLSQLPAQVTSITTRRKNPFDDDLEDIRHLPPIPGSAPSVLLGKSNPFNFPDKHFAQSGVGPSEPHFERFTVGTSESGREAKQNVGMTPYFVPEQRPSPNYQRQFSELSYPRMQSMFKSEPLYPIPDQEYHRGLLEQNLHEEHFISFTKDDGASVTKTESNILEDGSFMAPITTSLPINAAAWTGPVDETGAFGHFDASGIPQVHGQSVVEAVCMDTVQYKSFTTLETKLDDSGTTVERTFHFDHHEKLDSPKHHSDETTESNSSTESETFSGSEHSNHGLLLASHPSIDEPVVLPSELSVLPEIADKLKAVSGLEEQSSDASRDSDALMERSGGIAMLGDMKEVDEHILSELDVVGDFRVVNLQAGQEQVEKDSQLDLKPENRDNKILNLDSCARQVDRKMKSVSESPVKEDMQVEAHSSPKAVDSDLQEIEARCLDDIDLALMHAEGYCHDSLVEVEAHSSSKAVDSDLQEIEARCLDDIDLELMRAEGLHGNHVEVEAHSGPKATDSDLQEIDARCLDDIDLELMRTEGSLRGERVEVEAHSGPKAADSDLQEIDARCLDDIDLELMRTEGSLHGDHAEVEAQSGPKAADSDLQEIDARCLDDIDLELMRTEGSLRGDRVEVEAQSGPKAADSDLQEIDARCLDDIDLELMRTEGSLHGDRVDVEAQSGPRAADSDLQEIDAQCLDDIDLELMRTEGSLRGYHVEVEAQSGPKAADSDLQEIDARCLDDIDLELMRTEGSLRGDRVEVEAQSGPKAADSDLQEIDARCLDDIDLELMRTEGSLHGDRVEVEAQSGSKAADSDLQEIDARCLDDIDLELMRTEGSLHGDRVEVEAQSGPKAADSDLQEIDAQCLDDIDLELMRTEGSLLGDRVEVEACSGPKAADSDLHLELMRTEDSLRGDHVEVEAQSSSKATDSDLHEIDARCLDDIDLELMHAEGFLHGNRVEVEAHSGPMAVQSDMHEIEARSLDDIDLAIMHAEGSLHGNLVEDTHPKQLNCQSDLQEIKAQSLDELHEALKKQETPREPGLISSKEHEKEESDLHEVKSRPVDELHNAFGKQDIPPELVVTPSEQVEDHSVENMHIEPSNEVTIGPSNDELLKSGQKTALLGPDIVLSELHETEESQSAKEIHETIGKEGLHSKTVVPDLHEIEVKSPEDLHKGLKTQDISPNAMQTSSDFPKAEAPETSHSESHPAEAQTSKDVSVVAHLNSPEKELHPVESTSLSSRNQVEDSVMETIQRDVQKPLEEMRNIGMIKLDLHEVEVQSLKDLDEASGQPQHKQQEVVVQSKAEAQTAKDINATPVPVPEAVSNDQTKHTGSKDVSSVDTEANDKKA